MNLYKVADKSSFVEETANYIINNFKDDLSKLKVILPSGYLCSHLQQFLVEKLGVSILPNIVPLSELTTESEEAFKIPSNEIGTATKLEERIILSETVHSYKKLGYNLSQSIRLSSQLASLFYELEANEITIEKLKDIPPITQSLHWHSIYDFLIFSNEEWQIKLKKLGKLSRASYQQLMFNAEIDRIKANPTNFFLIAGIMGNDLQTQKFIQKLSLLPNGHLILPPISNADPLSQTLPEQPLFNICKLISLMEQKFVKFNSLGTCSDTLINKLIEGKSGEKLDNLINYVEFDNIFDEASYLASLIENQLAYDNYDNKVKIAFVLNNTQTKEIYTNFLEKYGITYHDLIGQDLLQINAISFILSIAELLCTEFSLKKLFNLLGNPLINQLNTIKVKNLLIKENRFVTNLIQVQKIVDNYGDWQLKEWFDHLFELFISPQQSYSLDAVTLPSTMTTFNQMLRQVILISEKLCPQIWLLNAKYNLSDAISEIIAQEWEFKFENTDEFPEALRGIMAGGKVFPQTSVFNVILCRAHDVALINFDHIIIADFSEGNYPAESKSSPWMNRHMQEKLGLHTQPALYGNSLYEFYLLLNNPNITITRSKKQITGKSLSKSHFLLRLETILGDKLNKSIGKIEEPQIAPINNEKFIIGNFFPKQISATDIEMLIRSPYNFYSKKILKLKRLNLIEDSPNLAEFGNFFHKVAEQYTKNYNKGEQDKTLAFIQLGENILKQNVFPEHSQKHWQTKLIALADDFTIFDEERRKNTNEVHSEIRGSIKLQIAGKEIEIIAIADRIEINKNGKAVILDYKTGAIPTKKEILSGLSPQLIIEALIMIENGFGLGKLETEQLVYIKIGSAKPYINITEINLTQADLDEHKQGLIGLLEHYITSNKYLIEPNLLRYDDYKHLSRR